MAARGAAVVGSWSLAIVQLAWTFPGMTLQGRISFRNCYAVAKQGGCSKRRFHGLSSAAACCACGGGLRRATAFRYYTEPLLVGDTAGEVKGYPLPRTAERYSVSSDCDLLSLNLTIDGNTGQLRFIKGCSSVGCGMKLHSDFQASCTITAHEGSLEASASLTITGSHFMVWPSSVLIVPTGGQHLFPSRSVCTSYGPSATAQLLEDAKLANGTTTPAATTTTTPAATTTAGKDTTT
eukprot:symbB.v1.2.038585.t1/scaffold5977.1/size23871/1